MEASEWGLTEVVQLLLSKGAAIDEKDNDGRTALMLASKRGRTEAMQLLLGHGAAIDEKGQHGRRASTLPLVVTFDEDQLGRMAASLVHCQLLKAQKQDWYAERAVEADEHFKSLQESAHKAALDATATAVLQLVHLAGFARERALKLRSSAAHSADAPPSAPSRTRTRTRPR